MQDFAEELNGWSMGWNQAMNLRFLRATVQEVTAEVVIGPQHHQPYGIVHGGVYAGVIETLCSTGAALVALPRGQTAVGLENSTSFLHAVRQGKLLARATPVMTGRRVQVWECTITSEDGKPAATGRVRMLCLESGAAIAGETVSMKVNEREGQ